MLEDEMIPTMRTYQEEILKEMKEKIIEEPIPGRTKNKKRKKIGGKKEMKEAK